MSDTYQKYPQTRIAVSAHSTGTLQFDCSVPARSSSSKKTSSLLSTCHNFTRKKVNKGVLSFLILEIRGQILPVSFFFANPKQHTNWGKIPENHCRFKLLGEKESSPRNHKKSLPFEDARHAFTSWNFKVFKGSVFVTSPDQPPPPSLTDWWEFDLGVQVANDNKYPSDVCR